MDPPPQPEGLGLLGGILEWKGDSRSYYIFILYLFKYPLERGMELDNIIFLFLTILYA